MLHMPDKTLTADQRRDNAEAVKHVKEWLRVKGVTQNQVAEALNVSHPLVSKWMNGHIALTVKQLRAIERLLKVSPGALLSSPHEANANLRAEEVNRVATQLSDQAYQSWLSIGEQLINSNK